MTESGLQPGLWTTPECPFQVEYDVGVLEEIRLAVVEAFFSLPRGGAEVGGVLFGTREQERVRILAHRPLLCEHALGPSFVLSAGDHQRLRELLDRAVQDESLAGLTPVGWYHSHTRSEIFLTDADREIHQRYFPEPWQIALVLRPASMQPTRCGFFFRQPDGSIQAAATCPEFVLHALTARPASRRPEAEPARAAEAASEAATARAQAVAKAVMPLYDEPVAAPPPAEPAREAEQLPVVKNGGARRAWQWAAVLLLAASLAAAGYATRDYWMGILTDRPIPLRLQAIEREGQLMISWDRSARPIQECRSGSLEITDGGSKLMVVLDELKLHAGSFTYARQSEIVELHLTVQRADGSRQEEFTSFLGPPIPQKPGAPDPEAQRERDELAKEAERVRSDLKNQEKRTRQLQRTLDEMRVLMRREDERRRLQNQNPAARKQ